VSFNADRLTILPPGRKNWVGFQFKAGQTSCLFLVLGNVISVNPLYVVVGFFLLEKNCWM